MQSGGGGGVGGVCHKVEGMFSKAGTSSQGGRYSKGYDLAASY